MDAEACKAGLERESLLTDSRNGMPHSESSSATEKVAPVVVRGTASGTCVVDEADECRAAKGGKGCNEFESEGEFEKPNFLLSNERVSSSGFPVTFNEQSNLSRKGCGISRLCCFADGVQRGHAACALQEASICSEVANGPSRQSECPAFDPSKGEAVEVGETQETIGQPRMDIKEDGCPAGDEPTKAGRLVIIKEMQTELCQEEDKLTKVLPGHDATREQAPSSEDDAPLAVDKTASDRDSERALLSPRPSAPQQRNDVVLTAEGDSRRVKGMRKEASHFPFQEILRRRDIFSRNAG